LKREITYHHLSGLNRGDPECFRRIYDAYHSLIYYYTLKFIQLENLAEEATADVFIILWKKRALIDPNSTIQAFLFKIAKDTAYNYLKKIATDARLKEKYLEKYPCIDIKNGEVIFLEKEGLAQLNGIIDTLPPKRLEVFKLRYQEGFDNQRIAQELGISINTVKVHLAKARLYLRSFNLNINGS